MQCIASAPLADGHPELMSSPEVTAIAKELGKSEAEVALKWNTQRGIPVMPQLQSGSDEVMDLSSYFTWKLSNEQKATPPPPPPLLAPFQYGETEQLFVNGGSPHRWMDGWMDGVSE